MTPYDETMPNVEVAFRKEEIRNTFGEYISKKGLKQLRIAETEKYAHVTFFFNGGEEKQYEGEDRILVPSPKVETYDLKPEMSAYEVTDKVIEAIKSEKYDSIILNYANPDMVGHTGSIDAAVKALETINDCVAKVVEAVKSVDGVLLITADHGNAEQMIDYKTGEPWTAQYGSLSRNLLYFQNEWDNSSKNFKVSANETITVHLMKDLDLRSVFSYDYSETKDHIYYSPLHWTGSSDNGVVHEMSTNSTTLVSSTTLNYNKTFGEKHTLGVLAGFEIEDKETRFMRATGKNLPSSSFGEIR